MKLPRGLASKTKGCLATRRVEKLAETLGIKSLSKRQVSELSKRALRQDRQTALSVKCRPSRISPGHRIRCARCPGACGGQDQPVTR